MEDTQNAGGDDDLPLMSNTSDVLVRHFILDLECSMSNRTLSGSITLFLDLSRDGNNLQVFSIQEFQKHPAEQLKKVEEPTSLCADDNMQQISLENAHEPRKKAHNENQPFNSLNLDEHEKSAGPTMSRCEEGKRPFQLILDCCDLDITKVEAIDCNKTHKDWLRLFSRDLDISADEFLELSRQSFSKRMNYATDKWCLKVWDLEILKPVDFAHCIKIHYNTKPEGSSLRWAVDQDGNPCVYTSGMWVNNRSLMPCQEYGSLSTWQAIIRVPSQLTVLMSADDKGSIAAEGDTAVHYYRSRMPLPSFSLAIAIGSWQCQVISKLDHNKIDDGCNNYVKEVDEVITKQTDHDSTCSSVSSNEIDVEQRYPYLQKTCNP
ncbi:hypothetical protein LSH36_14g00029 [Paralvinella palmiformis]|uniref:Uncharacterized protein n=1 Tax=Paralvinella palmiformis TaxID=53620 RepID=A0AAD9NIU3_9ANNE|nr:hypothetical protein LSH36_14g00029 [Paralvinella palmiformis]